LALWGVLACGGAQKDAEDASQVEPAAAEEPVPTEASAPVAPVEETAPPGLPMECTPKDHLCLPPRPFVKRLCQDAFSGAAIRLFEKRSPFTRGYVAGRRIKAVNTIGGPSSDAELDLGEEVVILTHTGGPGANEMQVSGMGGYDVLRWDGTCASLSDGELALRAPKSPRHAPIAWQYIDTNIQKALLADEKISEARREQKKHCHGVTTGRVSSACEKADAQFYDRIASTVRNGIELPDPDRMP
jgi:hypothetical protein